MKKKKKESGTGIWKGKRKRSLTKYGRERLGRVLDPRIKKTEEREDERRRWWGYEKIQG